jgi:hypothetical protein
MIKYYLIILLDVSCLLKQHKSFWNEDLKDFFSSFWLILMVKIVLPTYNFTGFSAISALNLNGFCIKTREPNLDARSSIKKVFLL